MDLEHKAFARLQEGALMSKQYYNAPLIICYSGGKDSDVLVQLAINSGIDCEILHNHTTADAPETVYYIRQRFKEWEAKGIKCTISYPTYKGKRTSMWELIVEEKMPPTRIVRYCCEVLKEKGGEHRAVATGVRWAESNARKNKGIYEDFNKNKDKRIILNNDNDDKRRLFERCELQAKTVVNPIVDWTEADIWEYIKTEQIPCNPLYECGFNRVGCIGCSMANKKRYKQFAQYPKYEQLYIHAFERMVQKREADGKTNNSKWRDGEAVFRWWMGEDPDQLRIDDVFEFEKGAEQ